MLLRHRVFPVKNPIVLRAKQYLLDNFYVSVNAYDIVKGYRVDDSYFNYAEAFVNNALSVTQLAKAMMLGKLGEQVAIKFEFAFSKLEFQGFELAEKDTYYVLRKARDEEANRSYLILAEDDEGLYVRDLIKGGIKNDDARIPRNIPR